MLGAAPAAGAATEAAAAVAAVEATDMAPLDAEEAFVEDEVMAAAAEPHGDDG